jgi:hypothetical protein
MYPLFFMVPNFNPIWATLLALIVLICLTRWTGLWTHYRYRIIAGLIALYAIDTAIALPRVLFAYSLPDHPTVAQKIPPPRELVLVNVSCWAKCHEMLISGAIEDIVVIKPRVSGEELRAMRYRAGWSIPGACPRERRIALDYPSDGLLKDGYCPQVEATDIPSQGIFVIRESVGVSASQPARPFTPTYLIKSPPGSVIQFVGVEVQNRSVSGVAVLASTYSYVGPGFVGLPPLIGCWERPGEEIPVLPPGTSGCGLWRWFTWGGDKKASADPKWFYDNLFGPSDRPVIPPKKPEFSPPAPVEALEILANVQPIEDYLPGLRDQVLDPANTDQALTEFVARLANRGTLEGSLIVLLAINRPAALAGIAALFKPGPIAFAQSGTVLAEMEKNPKFRDEFGDTMFLALAANWQPAENVDRFLTLMETSHPGWLCNHLRRFTGPDGILAAREARKTPMASEAISRFVPSIIEKTAGSCPDQTLEFLRELLSAPSPGWRRTIAELVVRQVPELAPRLATQATVNLTENVSASQPYFEAQLALLRAAGQSCDMLTRNIEAYISRESEYHRVASEITFENLARIRNGQTGGYCRN